VDHLGEVAGADLAGVDEAEVALRLEGVEERLHLRDLLRPAADHEGVALGEPPDPAADTAVDEADAGRLEVGGVALVVGVAGVAPVDDDVAGLEQPLQRVDRLVRRRARRHHHPRPRGASAAADQLLERGDVAAAVAERS
jgi:hypothetical protein